MCVQCPVVELALWHGCHPGSPQFEAAARLKMRYRFIWFRHGLTGGI
jgi:hypothetical protein